MKEEIIRISKLNNIDIIGFCSINDLIVPYDKYELQDKLKYKSTFQVGNISDKDLSNEKYSNYNSCIAIGISYKKVDMSDKSKVYLSSCSEGIDYHVIVREKLEVIGKYLNENNYNYKIFVDNNALDERVIAYNAGLGFFGVNNLLINDKLGSYFYIGVLLTDAVFDSDKRIDSKCINCGLCKKVCPNGAINDNGILDSSKCISYLNQKKNITDSESEYFDNCIYGCDKCISICPYNNKIDVLYDKGIDIDEFLNMSDSEFDKEYSNKSCYWRSKKILDRNINIYINHLKKK